MKLFTFSISYIQRKRHWLKTWLNLFSFEKGGGQYGRRLACLKVPTTSFWNIPSTLSMWSDFDCFCLFCFFLREERWRERGGLGPWSAPSFRQRRHGGEHPTAAGHQRRKSTVYLVFTGFVSVSSSSVQFSLLHLFNKIEQRISFCSPFPAKGWPSLLCFAVLPGRIEIVQVWADFKEPWVAPAGGADEPALAALQPRANGPRPAAAAASPIGRRGAQEAPRPTRSHSVAGAEPVFFLF